MERRLFGGREEQIEWVDAPPDVERKLESNYENPFVNFAGSVAQCVFPYSISNQD